MEVQSAVRAAEAQCHNVDVVIGLDPGKPASQLQGFITPLNHRSYLDNLFPAFLCMPNLRSLRLVRDRLSYSYLYASRVASKVPYWPSLKNELKMHQEYPLGHHDINAYYEKHGTIPKLAAPRGYETWAERFVEQHFAGKKIVVINPRQSALASVPTVTYRDAELDTWIKFLGTMSIKHPDVMFVPVGGYAEQDQRLLLCKNVFIPRCNGQNLAHELALLHKADMFIGTSSGFATYATFTDIPYGILNIEHMFADWVGLSVGDRHYPFGKANQILTWESETYESLVELFEEIYETLDSGRSRQCGQTAMPADV
ncbi:hypothetical protein [Magnetovibrio sp.]|uniref:hypothetical protein n=1 Tax=Magnetovibrio sp. TaxID=2024836 RepID=UPI002F92D6AD